MGTAVQQISDARAKELGWEFIAYYPNGVVAMMYSGDDAGPGVLQAIRNGWTVQAL